MHIYYSYEGVICLETTSIPSDLEDSQGEYLGQQQDVHSCSHVPRLKVLQQAGLGAQSTL